MTKLDIEGLPNGYAGLLIVVPPDFESGMYPPMNELIAPSSTAYGGESETAWAFVWPIDNQYKCCGWFSFCCLQDRVIPDNADVDPEHRRRGIASSVYRFVSLATNLDLTPGFDQTEDAVAFWRSFKKLTPNHN